MGLKLQLYDGNEYYDVTNLIRKMSLAGNSYVYSNILATTGAPLQTSVTAYDNAYSIFNPLASAKTVYLYSIKVNSTVTNTLVYLQSIVAETALAYTTGLARNLGGSVASVTTHRWSTLTTPSVVGADGAPILVYKVVADVNQELLDGDEVLALAPGTGIEIYHGVVTGDTLPFLVSIKGFETA
jgi:predicted RNA-binding protein with PUA-like domain